MLNIIFGRENASNLILDSRIYFSKNKKPEWFEDEFVKEFLAAIDKATVLFGEALSDYKGRGISTEMISTGSKTLCTIYFGERDNVYYGSTMGDNCIPFLMQIAGERDVTIVLEHYMDFPERYFVEKKITVNGEFVSQYEYDDAFSEWCSGGYEDE